MSIFDKWDKNVDTEGLQKDIAEAEANGGQGDYREVPVGTYVNKFLRSLDVNDTVEFKTYGQYNDMIMDMMESIDGSLEFLLEYGKNKKGYNTFKIKDVYEV